MTGFLRRKVARPIAWPTRCQAATAGICFTIQNEALETIEEQGAMDPDQRACLASPRPGPFSRHVRSSTCCITIAAQWRCSRRDPFEDLLRDIHTVAQQGQERILQLPGRRYSSLSAADVLRLIKQPSSPPGGLRKPADRMNEADAVELRVADQLVLDGNAPMPREPRSRLPTRRDKPMQMLAGQMRNAVSELRKDQKILAFNMHA